MNFDRINELAGELAALQFFPGDTAARLAIVQLIGRFAETEDQVRWLTRRMLDLYNEWPGPRELRAVFCSRHRPKDGIEARSERFRDGIPPERPAPHAALLEGAREAKAQLESQQQQPFAVGVELDAIVRRNAAIANAARRRAESRDDGPPNNNFTPLTQADIDAAIAAHRRKQSE